MSNDTKRYKTTGIFYRYSKLSGFNKFLINILLIVLIITPIVIGIRQSSIKALEKTIISNIENLAKEEYKINDAVISLEYKGIYESINKNYRKYDVTVYSSEFKNLSNNKKYKFIGSLSGVEGKAIVLGQVVSDGSTYDTFDGALRKNNEEIFVTTTKQNERKEKEHQKEIEEKRKNPFEFENVSTNKNGNYIYCTGYVKNISDLTFSYIKVKVTYYDNNEDVIDTDWTYAVGSEGLAPNERKSFEIMTRNNDSITKWRVDILDYD